MFFLQGGVGKSTVAVNLAYTLLEWELGLESLMLMSSVQAYQLWFLLKTGC